MLYVRTVLIEAREGEDGDDQMGPPRVELQVCGAIAPHGSRGAQLLSTLLLRSTWESHCRCLCKHS